jgi:hypothetical protein
VVRIHGSCLQATGEHLEGLAVGGEREKVGKREGDGEEHVNVFDVLASDALGPRLGLDAELDGEVESDLLGLVEEAHGGGAGPALVPHGGKDEAFDVC